MRKRVIGFFILAVLSGWVFFSLHSNAQDSAEEKPSPELLKLGKEIFNTKERLGVKYACILCHQQEKAIKKSALAKLGDKLPEIINLHILEKAKGKPIAPDSQEMKALEAYIRYEHSV